MSRATPDDQLKFLLNCVKHSNNGKIDFVEVAKECSIVSKGAAAKRYERLMKANGIHPNGGLSDKPSTIAAPRERPKAVSSKVTVSKKRKIEKSPADIKADTGDDGMLAKMKAEPKDPQQVKSEPTQNEQKPTIVKSCLPTAMLTPPASVNCSLPPQPQQQSHTPHTGSPQLRHYYPHMTQYQGPMAPLPHPPHLSPMSSYRYPPQRHSVLPQQIPSLEDTSMFEDFCTPELFEQRTFLEMPQMQLTPPAPPPPQEVTMTALSIHEKLDERPEKVLEKPTSKPAEKAPGKPAEPRSGRRPSESILVID